MPNKLCPVFANRYMYTVRARLTGNPEQGLPMSRFELGVRPHEMAVQYLFPIIIFDIVGPPFSRMTSRAYDNR